jgi:serine-type D-Ala-D-Ala carboxypeptidase/endopeptidase (penicillin-binding protein 4)
LITFEIQFQAMRKSIFAFTSLLLISWSSHVSLQGQTTYATVLAKVKSIAAEPGMLNGTLGFCLMDADTRTVLVDHQAQQSLLPASILKTVTTSAALGILGEDFKFNTALEYSGMIQEGVLAGDLFIRGGGDPSLGSDRFEGNATLDDLLRDWAAQVKAKGITRIEGRVIGDEEIFETQSVPETWVWQDMGNYYGAGPSGLTVMENTYYLFFKPAARAGDPAAFLRCEPPMPDIEFVNEMKTGGPGSGDNGYIYGGPYTYLRYLRGSIPQGKPEFSIKGSIPDPAMYCAEKMVDCLKEAGIEVMAPASSSREEIKLGRWKKDARTLLATHESPPLKDIVFWVNKKSVNLFAEHLLKYIGYHKTGKGSTEAGTEAVKNYFALKGIDVRGLHLLDGSGLSRYNGITPAQLAGILALQTKQPHWESFWNSLPIAGDPDDVGSIKDMCVNTIAAKNVRAKSGYIMRVRTYAGFVRTKSGKLLSFSMMPNNFTMSNAEMKKRLEDLMVMLAELD